MCGNAGHRPLRRMLPLQLFLSQMARRLQAATQRLGRATFRDRLQWGRAILVGVELLGLLIELLGLRLEMLLLLCGDQGKSEGVGVVAVHWKTMEK